MTDLSYQTLNPFLVTCGGGLSIGPGEGIIHHISHFHIFLLGRGGGHRLSRPKGHFSIKVSLYFPFIAYNIDLLYNVLISSL